MHMVTRFCLVPLYYGSSRKFFVVTLLPTSFLASSSEGSMTSQVAKIRRQKYWHGIPADSKSSSKVSFLIPDSLLFLKSVIMLDRVFGSVSVTNSGMESISVPLKYVAYFPTLSFSYCSELSFSFFFFLLPMKLALLMFSFPVECPGARISEMFGKPVTMVIPMLAPMALLPALPVSFGGLSGPS